MAQFEERKIIRQERVGTHLPIVNLYVLQKACSAILGCSIGAGEGIWTPDLKRPSDAPTGQVSFPLSSVIEF